MILEFEREAKKLSLQGYTAAKGGTFTQTEKRNAYLAEAMTCSDVPDSAREQITSYFLRAYSGRADERDESPTASAFVTKKYKPVALKVKPVYAELPGRYRIKREITGEPLAGMPQLNPRPPDFVPTTVELRGWKFTTLNG